MTRAFSETHRERLAASAKARCTPEWRAARAAAMRTAIDDSRLRALYADGRTQAECAADLGVTITVVQNAMKRLGIKARKAAKRNQVGSANSSWMGDAATYAALHKRVEIKRGKPCTCDHCTKASGRFEWANVSGNYADVNDYIRLCISCHRKFDAKRRKTTGGRTSDHVPRSRKESISC